MSQPTMQEKMQKAAALINKNYKPTWPIEWHSANDHLFCRFRAENGRTYFGTIHPDHNAVDLYVLRRHINLS